MFVLCHQNKDGSELYYTGRAGQGWVSSDLNEAFKYDYQPVGKMGMFNSNNQLHGLWFHVKQLVEA